MTKLSWDAPGERIYETGVDRGALYVNGTGYAWNGLLSIQEKSSGGNLTPLYLDGFKYGQLMATEEFEATLEALTSPREFGVCDGSVELYNGLFVTQQRRKTFGLSYRTLLGNDINATEYGYKLHIVYNALSGPSSRNNTTIKAAPSPISLSWQITTIPAEIDGIRPTAHFIIDSTKASSGVLSSVEDLLYGNESSSPTLPTPSALVAMFA